MALNLVAYDSSDNDSENEDVSETSQSKVEIVKNVATKNVTIEEDVGDVPAPSAKELELAEMVKKEKANITRVGFFSTQKKNGRVMIGIPSLSEFDEEEEEEKKSKTKSFIPSKGQSKLFSTLPQPKNSNYVPPTEEPELPAAAKPIPVKKGTSLIPHSVAKKLAKKDSDDEKDSGGFFTLDEPAVKPAPELFLPVAPVNNVSQVSSYQSEETSYYLPTNQQYNLANVDVPMTEPSDVELDRTALEALQGVKRKLPDDAQIIEIHGERLTYDPSQSQLKSISEERSAHNSDSTAFSKVQKKRHQITYLAAQAKAREVDLKNQWAQNKMSRRQTQQKYGF